MKEGWEYKKLGEVCEIIGGGTPDKKNKEYYDGNIPWATVRDMNVEWLGHTEYSITDKGLEKSASNIIPRGEVIIATRVGLGKVCLLKQDTAINQDLKGIVPKDDTNRRFLFYWFKFESKNIISNGVGATVKGVRISYIHDLLFPNITLSEQHRIVSYLDAAFAKIDAVAKNAEDALNEAKALFQSALTKMMEPKEGWEEKHLDEVAENCDSKRIPVKLGKRKGGEYPYYGASGIVDYVEDYIFDGDFLLISEDGANLLARVTPIAFSVTGKFWVNNHAHILKFNDVITQQFVEFYFKSINIKEYVTGAAQPKLTQRNLNKIPIYIPSLKEQQSVVCELQKLENITQQLQSNLTLTLSECAALKQSILRQTFE